MYRRRPEKVRPTQWLAWAALQAWFTPTAVYVYIDMSGPKYHLGYWALGTAILLIAIPTVYGLALVGQVFDRRRYDEESRKAYARPLTPSCVLCNTNPCSWNTRTNDWMDTCSSCRGGQHEDTDYLIG